MGNCLHVEDKVVRVMKMDGKVLEYQGPIKAFQILSEFKGHAISDPLLPGSNHLYPQTELLCGHLYHFVPVKVPAPKKTVTKKKVRFSIPDTQEKTVSEEKEQQAPGDDKVAASIDQGFKIKIVIAKAELRKMIENGLVSIDKSMTAAHTKLEKKNKEDDELLLSCSDDDYRSSDLWKPSLVSIPEGNCCNT